MPETLVKTCGITMPDDAVACVELGVDFLGLIFAFSPRHVTIEQAQSIRAAVPEARLVGVCVDEPLEALIALAGECRLNMVQLHGHESPEYCAQVARRAKLPVVKAVRGPAICGQDLEAYRPLHGVLFDLEKGVAPSAPALAELWSRAAEARQAGHRVFLGGGLDPDNVAAAVRLVRPYCVDVARGVECAPGVKDHDLVHRFLEEVEHA
jgi:phosphoribosylanthranilate isomerase